jgi:hypothetical protein
LPKAEYSLSLFEANRVLCSISSIQIGGVKARTWPIAIPLQALNQFVVMHLFAPSTLNRHSIPVILVIFLFCFAELNGQMIQLTPSTYPVSVNGVMLAHPFAGGINTPQISKADLNKDGIEDIFIFDRAGDAITTFAGKGQANYEYNQTLSAHFPPLRHWAFLRDYNRDGAPDLFCANTFPSVNGIRIFKGYWIGNELYFSQFFFRYPGCFSCDTQYIYYEDSDMPGFYNNLVIAETDLPAIDDIDGDGDLDILTFDPTAGGNIWFVKNLSMEQGYGDDSLKFDVTDKCFGRMFESGITKCKCELSPSPSVCKEFLQGDEPIRHPGSTILSFDADGDIDKELVLGDISFVCLNYLKNGGTPQNAWMTQQDTAFPSNSTPVDLTSFPAAFYFDVDNDGKNDLLAAPNSKNIVEDDQSIWYYRNIGSNTNHQFVLESQNQWQSGMIDIGTSSHPVFVDVNADGLLDLVAGNVGYYTIDNGIGNPNNSGLYLWLNTGTATAPVFTLNSRNWLNFGQFTPDEYDFSPAFGDLDNDNDLDLIVGNSIGILYYCRNTAGPNQPMAFTNPLQGYNYKMIDVGTSAAPLIWDIDGDGLKDLLIGERQGNINYFKNIGTSTAPDFGPDPTIQSLGAIDTREFPSTVGFSTPVIVSCSATDTRLLCGNQDGKLELYSGLAATSDSIPFLNGFVSGIDVGERSHPAVADIDNDGLYEVIVGTSRGGFRIFETNLNKNCTLTHTQSPVDDQLKIEVAPNPTSDVFTVSTESNQILRWRLTNQLGQIVQTGSSVLPVFSVSMNNESNGTYFLSIDTGSYLHTEKVMLLRP